MDRALRCLGEGSQRFSHFGGFFERYAYQLQICLSASLREGIHATGRQMVNARPLEIDE